MIKPENSDWSHFPDLHPVTTAALDEISAARYPSDAKKVARRAGSLVIKYRIPLAEMDAVMLAGALKARELTPHDPAEPENIPVSDAIPEDPGVPLDSLQAVKEPTWHSHAEYSLPRGDRD